MASAEQISLAASASIYKYEKEIGHHWTTCPNVIIMKHNGVGCVKEHNHGGMSRYFVYNYAVLIKHSRRKKRGKTKEWVVECREQGAWT